MFFYMDVLKKYADFGGRARRKEYWLFNLANLLVLMGITAVAGSVNQVAMIYLLVILVPSVAVAVRRMHDINHNGWWILCPVMNFAFACTEGTQGRNRYGRHARIRRVV